MASKKEVTDPGGTVKPSVKLQITGLGLDVNEQLVECYFDSKDLEVINVSLTGKGKAIVDLSDLKDIQTFCSKTHKIKGNAVTITQIQQPKEDDNDEADSNCIIEVTCPDDVDQEMLEMYFQGPKSGGSKEKSIEWIRMIESGKYRIKFEDPEDCAVVLGKKIHVMMRKQISITSLPSSGRVHTKTVASTETVFECNKLLIEDIHKDVSEEVLVTFLDSRLDPLEHTKDYTVNMKGTSALVTFKKEYSDEELIELCKKLRRKLKSQVLSVDRVQPTFTILITNISNKNFANADSLQIYFESPKSGGGEDLVEDVVMLGADRAKVTFKKFQVVSTVLEREHERLGKEVLVVPYSLFDDLEDKINDEAIGDGDTKSANSEPDPSLKSVKDPVPESKNKDPVNVPIDPIIGKYLHGKQDVLDELSKEIYMGIKIDTTRKIAILQPTDSSPPDYSEMSAKQFQQLLSDRGVCKVDIEIPSEVANAIYPMVGQRCANENLPLEFHDDCVSVVGMANVVEDIKKSVHEVCIRTIKTSEIHSFNHKEFLFITKCQAALIKTEHPGVEVSFDEQKHSLKVSGSKYDVSQFDKHLSSFKDHAEIPVNNLSLLAIEFLQTNKGASILRTIINHSSILPFFPHNNPTSFLLICSHENIQHAENIAIRIPSAIVENQLLCPQYFFTDVADSPQFSDFIQKTSASYAFSYKVDERKFTLVCQQEVSSKLYSMIEKFVKEKCSISEKISFKRGVWRVFNSPTMEDKWNNLKESIIKKGVEIPTISSFESPKPFIKIKGERSLVAEMRSKILELEALVFELKMTFSRPGVVQYFFKDPNGQFVLKGIEKEAKVCIELEVNKDEESADNLNSSFQQSNFKKVCSAIAKEGASVSVYVGDITQFTKADVIVNAANERLDHGAGIAGAIVKSGGPIIIKDSNDYVRKYGTVQTGSAIIFHQVGNLPPSYKAIVHAVGPIWNSYNSEKGKALLRKAVKASLKQAQGYSSIAIPAISSGLYGFPVDIAANCLVKGVTEYLNSDPDCSLHDINFIVWQDNVDVFIKAVNDHFKDVHTFGSAKPTQPAATASSMLLSDKSMTESFQMTGRTRKKASSNPSASAVTSHAGNSQSSILQFIKIIKGDILKHQSEVLVNTTDQKLGFGGYVGRVLLKAAGQGLDEECKAIVASKSIQYGDIITTGAHSLKSKKMIHVVLPGYNGSQSEMVLQSVVKKCLQECSRLKLQSVSFPSIGAGNLGYPCDIVAKCLLEETANYLAANKGKTSIQLVHFVIFDGTVYQAFQNKFSSISNISTNDSKSTIIAQGKKVTSGAVSRSPDTKVRHSDNVTPIRNKKSSRSSKSVPMQHVLEVDDSCSFALPNGIVLQLIKGDITTEQTDVVVNTTNAGLNLDQGGVSTALLKKAGPALQAACDAVVQQGMKAAEGKVVETRCEGIGQLQCKSIFHVVFEGNDQRKLVKTIHACLDRAEKMKYQSIALPAIGTGVISYPPHLSAEGIVKALKQFTQKKPRNVKVVRMVIFQPQMFQQFTDAFKKIGENENILNYIYDKGAKILNTVGSALFGNEEFDDEEMEWSVIPEKNFSSSDESDKDENTPLDESCFDSKEVIMCVYGNSDICVKRAEKKLSAIIDTIIVQDEVEDKTIVELSESVKISLSALGKEHNVDIEIDTDPDIHTVKLHGCQTDVLKVKDKVRDAIAEVHQRKAKENAASAVHKHVKWVRLLSNDEEEYSEVISYDIEQAFLKDKKATYTYQATDEQFQIDFSKMEETDLETGDTVNVVRVDYSEVDKPLNWDPMPKDANGREVTVHLVTLKQSDQEYIDALKRFEATMKSGYNAIVSIQRIQNPVLYGQYIARKKEMDKRNPPGCQNERWLFHGTNEHVVKNINTQGFNRSFKSTTIHGQGAYFARDAAYSDNGYAVPGANGHRHMYLTRVLTGEFTKGHSSMLVPPPKNNQANQHVLFDSTVDSVANPTIFVVYTDPQAYAAYLIIYK